jgi:hypothetical protein
MMIPPLFHGVSVASLVQNSPLFSEEGVAVGGNTVACNVWRNALPGSFAGPAWMVGVTPAHLVASACAVAVFATAVAPQFGVRVFVARTGVPVGMLVAVDV